MSGRKRKRRVPEPLREIGARPYGEHVLKYRRDYERKVVILEAIIKYDDVPAGVVIEAADS